MTMKTKPRATRAEPTRDVDDVTNVRVYFSALGGSLPPQETVMSWNGRPVVACPSAAGEGVRNLYAGGALVGVLRDDGGRFRVLYRRGHADEPKWVRPAETAYDTLKEAARAVLE